MSQVDSRDRDLARVLSRSDGEIALLAPLPTPSPTDPQESGKHDGHVQSNIDHKQHAVSKVRQLIEHW